MVLVIGPARVGVTTCFRVNPTLRPLTGLMTSAFHSLEGQKMHPNGTLQHGSPVIVH